MATKSHKKLSVEDAVQRFEEGIEPDPATRRGPEATADIRAAAKMLDYAESLLEENIVDARRRGVTWLEIALALGVTPQAVSQKYRDRI